MRSTLDAVSHEAYPIHIGSLDNSATRFPQVLDFCDICVDGYYDEGLRQSEFDELGDLVLRPISLDLATNIMQNGTWHEGRT